MRAFGFFVFLVLFISATAQKQAKFLESGKKLLDEEKFDPALQDFNKAIGLKPGDAEPYYYRGRCYLLMGKAAEAKIDLEKAIELDNKKSIYYNLLGIVNENLKDTAAAFDNYTKAIALDPSDCKPLSNLANWYEDRQQYTMALKYIGSCIKKCPGDPANLMAEGLIFEALKDTVAAVNDYKAAVRLDSTYAAAYYALAYMSNAKSDYRRALAYINKAIAGDPKSAENYMERAKSYEGLNDSINALASYSKAVEADPKNGLAWYSRANFYSLHNNHQAAINDYSKMIALDRNDPDALYARAECYADTDNYAAALADLELAKKLNPSDPYIYFQTGNCQDATRYYREAIESYNAAIKLDSNTFVRYRYRSLHNLACKRGIFIFKAMHNLFPNFFSSQFRYWDR
ncbi:MAG: tetratricopeptide repeat protein [Bacteroidia bacterium]